MSRFAALDLTAYRIDDILDPLSYEAMIARDRATFAARWAARRAVNPALPPYDTLALESDPANVVMEVGAYRELTVRADVNDQRRKLSLIGATGAALDHIGATYYNGTVRLSGEGDDQYRQRLALQPESLSTCGPEGGYTFWAASAHANVLDAATYSEDEGICLAPEIQIYVAAKTGAVTQDMLSAVLAAARAKDRRPKGDKVSAFAATDIPYAIDVTLMVRRLAGSEAIRQVAADNVLRYASGLVRYLDADNDDAGPSYVVGRTVSRQSIAGAAWAAGPDTIIEVRVNSPVADVNARHVDWAAQAAATYGQPGRTQPLDPALTAHLRAAPRCTSITVSVQQAGGFQ